MRTLLKSISFLFIIAVIISCSSGNRVELFNGENLDNWVFFTEEEGVDAGSVFWAGDGLIHTSGVPHAYIRTKESYGDFELHLEWRWVDEPTNSGVLIHVQGEDRIWPHCVECQLMHDHAGDLVLMGKGAGIVIGDSVYLVSSEENRYKVIPKFEDPSENPPGEWNSYDITSREDELEVRVNGVLQHKGRGMTPTMGHILLQSEGSAMEYRNLYLEAL